MLALAVASGSLADTKLSNGTVLSDSPTWIVIYIEVAESSVDETAGLIKKHTATSKSEKGNIRFEGLERLSRSNHFVILEAWDNPDARAAHAAAAHTQAFRKALQPMLYAPYDERPHVGLMTVDPELIPAGNRSTAYVITHADIVPPEQFAPCNRRPDPNGPCGNDLLINLAEDSRTHEGNMRFDVLTQSNRPNHMTVVEMWENRSFQEAHQTHPDKTRFRDELSGIEAGSGVNSDPQFVLNMMTGSLWDERLYKLISH